MPLLLFLPRVQYVPKLRRSGAVALDELCESACTVCGGGGVWAKRTGPSAPSLYTPSRTRQ